MEPTFDRAVAGIIGGGIAIGITATALMDLWLLGLRRAGVPTMDFALLGRWAGHLARGRIAHEAIRHAAPVRHEACVGWLVHYAVGVALAVLLVAWLGSTWLRNPTLAPAVIFGLATAAAPLLLLQPAMGAGIASTRTPAPWRNSLRSLANHGVFGVGLYLAAAAFAPLAD